MVDTTIVYIWMSRRKDSKSLLDVEAEDLESDSIGEKSPIATTEWGYYRGRAKGVANLWIWTRAMLPEERLCRGRLSTVEGVVHTVHGLRLKRGKNGREEEKLSEEGPYRDELNYSLLASLVAPTNTTRGE